MVQKVDPFVNLNWGWSDGENGWGAGMNENLITYSFFHNRRIQSIIANASLLPSSPADGEAHFSTADKTVYFRADGVWYFTVPPIGMEFTLTTTDTAYRFDGNALVVKTLDDFGVTPFGSSLLSAADAPAGRTVLGLGNVDNTSDLNKPISTATQAALDGKVSTVVGKQLSQEDYTSTEKAKLAGIAVGATANSSDTFLLSRNNHTGTQAISTITGLQTALDNKLDDSQLGAANGVAPLGSDGKVPAANLPASGSYSGTWNASTNTPTITSGSGTNGQFYIVSVAGTTSIDGVNTWGEGDQIRFNGTVWQRIPNTDAVTSVAGKTGTVTLVPADAGVNIGTNVQAWDADLDAIAALAGTSGLLRKTAANTWSLDTSSFITGNQTITLAGDASGSGTTSISVTLPATGVTAGTYKSVTVDTKGRVTAGTNPTTLAGYGITDAAPLSHVGTGGATHADATTSISGFMSGADKTKLNGIATGATANSSDAFLLSRNNHTGTQTSSAISDWTEAVQDVLGSTLVAGSNITLNYNDAVNTLTINSTASGGSSTFLGLTDTPSAYTSHASKAVRVNSGETGLEFVALGSAAFNNTGDFAGSSHSHDASAIITGTISDSRLPSTMSGKTFTSDVTLASTRLRGIYYGSISDRTYFQSSVSNNNTFVGCIPSGTAVESGFLAINNSSPSSPASATVYGTNASMSYIDSTYINGGSSLPISMLIGGTEAVRIATSRNVLIGTTTDAGYKLDVNGNARATNLALSSNSLTFGAGALGLISNTANSSEIHLRDNAGDFQGGLSSTNAHIGLSDVNSNLKLYVAHGGDTFCTTNFNVSGTISGNGSGLTNLNASNLSSGTVPTARLPTASTSSSGIVQLGDGSGAPSATKAATESWVYGINASVNSISGLVIYRDKPQQLFQNLGTVSGSVTVNASSGLHVAATVNGNTTWTFPSPDNSGLALAITLELTNGGAYTMTWPAGTRWAGGVAPTLTTSGTDILVFTKAGTNNWRGYLSSKDNK